MSVYRDVLHLQNGGFDALEPDHAPEPGTAASEREKRALEAWKRQLEQRVSLIEDRLRLMQRGKSQHDN